MLCFFQTLYPTVTDIDLAIERTLLNRYILRCISQKNKVIMEDFSVPPYILDFGHVVLFSSVCFTVNLTNQTCVQVECKYDKKGFHNTLEFDEFKVEFGYKRLEVGQSTEMYVLFKPTRRRYGLTETRVENTISLRLRQGGCVPINVLAVVTMPRMTFQQNYIDFGTVIVGEAMKKTVVVTNE